MQLLMIAIVKNYKGHTLRADCVFICENNVDDKKKKLKEHILVVRKLWATSTFPCDFLHFFHIFFNELVLLL